MDGAVLRGGGSVLCLLLLPGEVVAGWGATPRTVVAISEEKALLGGQRTVERSVTAARILNGGAARDPKAHKVSLSSSLAILLIHCCLPVDLKTLRRECHETSAATDIARHRQHCRMANPRCTDIPNPDSPH